MVKLVLRLEFPDRFGLGRGKIELLEQIRQAGSISAAGRAMSMSYRRAWLLVDSMNQAFPPGVVETAQGGERGGGARLTRLGEMLIERFRRAEALAGRAAAAELEALGAARGKARVAPTYRRPAARAGAKAEASRRPPR